MHSNIDKYTKVNDISHGSFQNHSFLQILHIKDIRPENWFRHLISWITRRFFQLFDNIPKGDLSYSKFFSELFVIFDGKRQTCKFAACNIFRLEALLFKKLSCRLVRLRMYTGSVKWIGSALDPHKPGTLLKCFWSKFWYFEKFFSVCKLTVLFSVSYDIFGNCFADTGNILKQRCRCCI